VDGDNVSLSSAKGTRYVQRLASLFCHKQGFGKWARFRIVLDHIARCHHSLYILIRHFPLAHVLLGVQGYKVTIL
jgi:hypothetical protein